MTDDGNPILVRVPTRPSPYPEAWRAAADQLLTDLGFEPGYLSWALARDVVCRAFADAVTRALGPTPSGDAPAAGVTGHWWCPECRQPVEPVHVTYEEYHETCGTRVQWKDARGGAAPAAGVQEAVALAEAYVALVNARCTCTPEEKAAGKRCPIMDLADPLYEARMAYEARRGGAGA